MRPVPVEEKFDLAGAIVALTAAHEIALYSFSTRL
jgi:hypothetical protein